jgi:hypothetical protein
MKKHIISVAFLHALAAAAYIALIVSVMVNGKFLLGDDKPPFTGIAMLMLFVLSVAVMFSLAFLRPILWYLDGKKKEAIQFFSWTFAFFFVLTVIAFVCVAVIQ